MRLRRTRGGPPSSITFFGHGALAEVHCSITKALPVAAADGSIVPKSKCFYHSLSRSRLAVINEPAQCTSMCPTMMTFSFTLSGLARERKKTPCSFQKETDPKTRNQYVV